ncbi:putative small G-protein Ras2 [Nemania serpens]|nr:putative small G-protein Ras2 [Nemania serpens]
MQAESLPYRVAVLGDCGVGKTALTIRLCLKRFDEQYDPTIEDLYHTQASNNDETFTVEVLDTAGQEEYRSQQSEWIRQSHGIVLVYSVISRASFSHIHDLCRPVLMLKEWDSTSAEPPIMIVGNKCDKTDGRQVQGWEGHSLARQHGCQFLETSAKLDKNVKKVFFDVAKLAHRLHTPSPTVEQPTRGKGCCIIM